MGLSGRLLKCLEEGIGGLVAQEVDGIEDDEAGAGLCGAILGDGDGLSDLLNLVVSAVGGLLDKVGMGACEHAPAGAANAAGFVKRGVEPERLRRCAEG